MSAVVSAAHSRKKEVESIEIKIGRFDICWILAGQPVFLVASLAQFCNARNGGSRLPDLLTSDIRQYWGNPLPLILTPRAQLRPLVSNLSKSVLILGEKWFVSHFETFCLFLAKEVFYSMQSDLPPLFKNKLQKHLSQDEEHGSWTSSSEWLTQWYMVWRLYSCGLHHDQ